MWPVAWRHTQRRHPKVASLFCCHYASFNAAHVLADYLAAPLSGTNLISWLLVAAVPKLKRP